MLTVALVGADGAGKSTIVGRLDEALGALGLPVRTMYLGVNPAAATHPLPSTRAVRWVRRRTGRERHAGGPPPVQPRPAAADRRGVRRAVGEAASLARVANRIAEETYQRAVWRWHLARGRVVVFDRYYAADHHAHDLAGGADLPPAKRLHAAYLRRWYPAPDLVIVLDAPPDVLHARKGEGTLPELASRRAEYLAYARTVPNALVVDAGRQLEQVLGVVVAAIGQAVHEPRPAPVADRPLPGDAAGGAR